jgi:GDPmannose 4,6-dehydratase
VRALITGVTGQDGNYLAKHLLGLGYRVFGGYRRSSQALVPASVEPVPLELLEYESVRRAVERVKPDEIYNLGAQTHVGDSFGSPIYTSDTNYLGVARLLEVVRGTSTRVYQASTSEMYGGGRALNEQSLFAPRSPYAVAKLAAHRLCGVYRAAYGVRVSCGILFNHESPLRGKDFVTRKITSHFANKLSVKLGNVNARRDWGHAKDDVRAMHLMLQSEPDDFVVATGESHTVEEFIREAQKHAPWPCYWFSDVEAQKRPWDVDELEGDSTKIREKLGWKPVYSFEALVRDMMLSDLAEAKMLRLAS